MVPGPVREPCTSVLGQVPRCPPLNTEMSAARWGTGGTEISPGGLLGPRGQQGPWGPASRAAASQGAKLKNVLSAGVPVSSCCCWWPQRGGLKPHTDSLTAWSPEVTVSVFLGWNQGDGRDLLPPEAHGKIFLFALSSFQSSMPCACERSLRLQYSIATSSQQISLCLSLTRTFVITFRAHPDNPG